jgi:hypothetical protein
MTDQMQQTDVKVDSERKRLESVWWAGVLIWVGLVLGAEYLEILPHIGERASFWPWFFLGIGPWTLGLNLYRVMSAAAPRPNTWDWIWTAVFMLVAIGTLVDIGAEIVGAAVLVVVGAVVMSRALSRG